MNELLDEHKIRTMEVMHTFQMFSGSSLSHTRNNFISRTRQLQNCWLQHHESNFIPRETHQWAWNLAWNFPKSLGESSMLLSAATGQHLVMTGFLDYHDDQALFGREDFSFG